MTKLTETQTTILTSGAQRPDNVAMPLPKGLAGAAAKMAVTKLIERGWLQEVDANLRRGEPLWRETGDGHGTTLVVTYAGLRAIGIEPVVVKTMTDIHKHAAEPTPPKPPTPRAGTKQAMLISLLQAPGGATMEGMMTATSWKPHTLRGAMSGALSNKLGLIVTSAKEGNGAGLSDQRRVGLIRRRFCGQSVQQSIVNLGRLTCGAVDRDHVLRAG